ncbi:MAG: hypothetical protein J5701_03955 [Bacteroidales bacterium]|nr:hypothetical protein [Bacteroidales bacterium]
MVESLKLSYFVGSYNINHKLQLSIDHLLMFMQETASRHIDLNHFGWHELQQEHQFWVLSKIELHIMHTANWNDTIQVETWGKKTELLSLYRDFIISDMQDRPIAKATSAWLILDTDTHKPVIPDRYIQDFPSCPHRNAIETKPQKVAMPAGIPYTESDIRKVHVSDIDMNLHANNTHYIRWAMDEIPLNFARHHHLSRIAVNFNSEARYDDKFRIRTAQNNLQFTQQMIRMEDNCILAQIQTTWQED